MAAGDCCILREATAGDTSNSTSFADYDWDTEVHRDSGSFSLSGSTGIQCLNAAPHLVVYNNSYQGGGTNRSELANRVEVNGTRTLSGQTTSYIRRSGDSYSAQCGVSLIETSANDVVTVAHARTDSNTGGATCTRVANESGFSVIELDDSWAYFRGIDLTLQSLTHASGETPPVTAASYEWQDVLIRTEFRKDTGYTHSTSTNPAEITLAGARRYLILYTLKFQNSSSSVRVNGLGRLVYDGVQVPASVATGYARGSDGCQDPIACGAVLFSPTGRNKILKLQAACDQEGTGTLSVNEASIDIIDLGLDIDVAILRQSADHDHNVARTAYDSIDWDTQDALDTASFVHSTTVNPQEVEIQESGRILAISSFFHVRTGINTVRKRPRVKFRRYVPLLTAFNNYQYGHGDNFNRGDQSTTSTWTAGGIGAGVFEVVADDLFEAAGCDPASTVDNATAWAADDCGLFLIDLSTMVAAPAAITGTLGADTPAPTSELDGTPTPITGTVGGTTAAVEASLTGGPTAATGTIGATTSSLDSSLDGGPTAVTCTLAPTTPAATADLAGGPGPAVGVMDAEVPASVADLAGTYTPAAISGTLGAATPVPTADLAGASGVAPIMGSLGVLTPVAQSSITADVIEPVPLISGTLGATTPLPQVDLAGAPTPVTGLLGAETPVPDAWFTDLVESPGLPGTIRPRPARSGNVESRATRTGNVRERAAL